MSFADVIAGAGPPEGGPGSSLSLSVPPEWHQGRTAYGGFSAALCLEAALQAGGRAGGEGLPPLRSAQFSMIAPVAGEVAVSASILRRGRNAVWAEARITCGGAVAFLASFVFMGAVASSIHLHQRPAPAGLVAPEAARAVSYTEHTPAFLRNHFEARHALPPSSDARAEMCRWVRMAGAGALDPMVALVLLADALPPGVMPLLTAKVPVSTMHWQVNLLTPAPATRDGWWLLRSASDYAEAGCTSQDMAIWNADGVAVMAGLQSVALFG